jgi:hypothetical protein
MDLVAEMVSWLNDDTEIMVEGFTVVGIRIPQDTPAPLVLITMVSQTGSTAPQTGWWKTLLALDFHAEDPKQTREMAFHIASRAPQFAGIHGTAVVTDSQVVSNQSLVDDGWTPTRFRQIVTVEVTAREP